ncbi:antitoxin [Salmonella enterica]|uniref:Antitoxin n=1 Tax=Salmonella enterica subsp. enterica serovar Pensacola TaxID=34042 RepID=A0A602Z4P8_SALET|nr:antitoxin [Salmonella enterica]ECT8498432.1 antitoxin [Salmonella enterica subsp. enterica serovar Pensacola]EBO9451419.1 antitoxin [Salmonella enterica]EBT4615303.1 antitoxin [Salmonella enterica]EDJ0353775.1 antitoxin [Salmonella enterica]
MGTVLSPIVSEFETVEQEASYNEWLKAKVAASLADTRPAVPHDEVMAEINALIDQIVAGKGDYARRQFPEEEGSGFMC